jgi:hypothetical protein
MNQGEFQKLLYLHTRAGTYAYILPFIPLLCDDFLRPSDRQQPYVPYGDRPRCPVVQLSYGRCMLLAFPSRSSEHMPGLQLWVSESSTQTTISSGSLLYVHCLTPITLMAVD